MDLSPVGAVSDQVYSLAVDIDRVDVMLIRTIRVFGRAERKPFLSWIAVVNPNYVVAGRGDPQSVLMCIDLVQIA